MAATIGVMADWRVLLGGVGYRMMPGASPEATDAAERAAGLRFPGLLRSLYLASDGVFDTVGQWWVIWPLKMVARENTARRKANVLPAGLLAFGDDGAGNPFCAEPGQPGVCCWHPIGDWKQPLAPDLVAFWRGWTAGTIST